MERSDAVVVINVLLSYKYIRSYWSFPYKMQHMIKPMKWYWKYEDNKLISTTQYQYDVHISTSVCMLGLINYFTFKWHVRTKCSYYLGTLFYIAMFWFGWVGINSSYLKIGIINYPSFFSKCTTQGRLYFVQMSTICIAFFWQVTG